MSNHWRLHFSPLVIIAWWPNNRSYHWTLPWLKWTQSAPLQPNTLRPILISSCHLGVSSSLYFEVSWLIFCMHFSFMPHLHHTSSHVILWGDQSNNIWLRVQIMKVLIVQFFHPPATSSVLVETLGAFRSCISLLLLDSEEYWALHNIILCGM
jgi:hypothetical protein